MTGDGQGSNIDGGGAMVNRCQVVGLKVGILGSLVVYPKTIGSLTCRVSSTDQ
jgi:hypothetical protein